MYRIWHEIGSENVMLDRREFSFYVIVLLHFTTNIK